MPAARQNPNEAVEPTTMITTALLLQRLPRLLPACAAFILVVAAAPSHAQSVAVMVNGEPITNYDIEQRSKLDFLSTHKKLSRKEVIDELIDQKVKIREAKQFGVDPTGSDIDASFAQMSSRMRMTPDQLAKTLEKQGIRPETLKERIRADMVWTSLVRGRYKESLQVGEKDVAAAAAVEVKGDEKDAKLDTESYEYKMQPIVLIVPRGSPPAAMEAKQKEAEALRGRIQSCAEANNYFRSMPNTAIRETVTKTSADLPPSLREVLDKTPIGHLTAPEVTKQGIEMVALCERKQTTVDTPKKKEIREKMYNAKFEAKSKAYLEQVRKAAMIEYR
jgi:peptidyl-prolyl cis-trans isomerase SurA